MCLHALISLNRNESCPFSDPEFPICMNLKHSNQIVLFIYKCVFCTNIRMYVPISTVRSRESHWNNVTGATESILLVCLDDNRKADMYVRRALWDIFSK